MWLARLEGPEPRLDAASGVGRRRIMGAEMRPVRTAPRAVVLLCAYLQTIVFIQPIRPSQVPRHEHHRPRKGDGTTHDFPQHSHQVLSPA